MKSSFQRLMLGFTVILSLIICITTAIFLNVSIKNYKLEQKNVQNLAITKVSDELQNEITITNNIANYISENQSRINNIHNYLRNDPAKYSKQIIDDSYQNNDYFNWPKANESFYVTYPTLTNLSVQFDDINVASQSSRYNTNGRKIASNKAFNPRMIYSNIISPQQDSIVGIVGANYDQKILNKDLNRISNHTKLQLVLMSQDGRVLYNFADKSISNSERKHIRRVFNDKGVLGLKDYSYKKADLDKGYVVYTFFNDVDSKKLIFKRILPILICGVIVLSLLLGSFIAIFTRYRKQLSEIIKTTKQVSNNDLNARVKIDSSHYGDLNLLSHSINTMLDEINNYINTIYKMRIAQQDAHMKSLQAQISPHFMANTLEYIRMSALDIGARDLAKVVFSFASLLRSNVGNQVQSTIKAEIKLVKNYIFLYQVRFPDKLAYQINVDPDLDNVKIPKFTLQPIIENYFAHGVNFANGNNAVKVKGWLENGRVNIWVIDNGKHIDVEELSKLNLHLQEPIVGDKSIGLQNVYARMSNYTHNFKMMIINNRYGGITVKLSFDFES